MSRHPHPTGIPVRPASSTQLSEIRRLSHAVLGRDWPRDLHPVDNAIRADKVLRALHQAYGIDTVGADPDLIAQIRHHQPLERRPSMSIRNVRNGETWLDWAASLTGYKGEPRPCPECGGQGEISALPSTSDFLCAITGLDSPTVTPKRAMSRLTNPDLETLRRTADLLGSSLDDAATFIEDLVLAFDTHPTRTRRRKTA